MNVPDFQREYVWQQDNVDRLLDDVFNEFCGEDNRPINDAEYFVGSIVVCLGEDGTYQLIDGQQRMTTSFLILCAIRDYLIEANANVPEALKLQIASVSTNLQTGEDEFRYRLALQYEDSDHVLERIASRRTPIEDIQRTTASVRNILAAYDTIKEFLKVNFDNDPARIKAFFATFTSRVKLIRIKTPNLTHALKVFETINDRGIGLNSMDLLKNLLFIQTGSEDFPKLKQYWKTLTDTLDKCKEKPLRFLRYYIMSQHTIDWTKGLREDGLYQWFVDNRDIVGIRREPLNFAKSLIARSQEYSYFAEGKDPQGAPNPYLRNIALLSGAARQHFILLLAGWHLAPELFKELCRQIENLFFCYIITREPAKTFERNLPRWSPELRAVKDEQGLEGFLEKYFKPDLAAHSKSFDFEFSQLSQSSIRQYRMRYILAKLTQYVDEQAWGTMGIEQYIDNKSVHIEHILPQSPTPGVKAAFDKPDEYATYVAKLGNLTLLEKTINASVSNGPYQEKEQGYRQSKFLLTKSLVEKPQVGKSTSLNRAVQDLPQFKEWVSESIEKRQAMLGQLARRVWLPDIAETSETR